MEEDRLLAAVADSHRAWFRHLAGGEEIEVAGTRLFPGSHAMTFPEGAVDVDALLQEIRARECRGAGCWALGEDLELGTRLTARGFQWGWRPHWMALELDLEFLGGAACDPPHLVEPASPPYAAELPYAPNAGEQEADLHLGVRLGGEVVGHVTVQLHDGVAGIYSMGVAPGARRRGIGRALTLAACRLAAQRGARHAVLNATDEGGLLYAALGFRSLGWGLTWWWFPRPAPSRRQIALAEAVGFGELSALEELRPTTRELGQRLPCGERPLVLALLTDQPAVAAWLLARRPELAAARYGAHQGTLLHAAAEHDRPRFVELALAHGVDPGIRDRTFRATALGWAEHFGRSELAAQLAAVTGL